MKLTIEGTFHLVNAQNKFGVSITRDERDELAAELEELINNFLPQIPEGSMPINTEVSIIGTD